MSTPLARGALSPELASLPLQSRHPPRPRLQGCSYHPLSRAEEKRLLRAFPDLKGASSDRPLSSVLLAFRFLSVAGQQHAVADLT